MSDAEHAEAVHVARMALNDALYEAWKDGLSLTVEVVNAQPRSEKEYWDSARKQNGTPCKVVASLVRPILPPPPPPLDPEEVARLKAKWADLYRSRSG